MSIFYFITEFIGVKYLLSADFHVSRGVNFDVTSLDESRGIG